MKTHPKKNATLFTRALLWLSASGHLTPKRDVNQSDKPIVAHLVAAANEEMPAANEAISLGSFTIQQTDGFSIKYGTYPHEVGLQIFDKEAATVMANELSSLMGKVTRLFRGVPVYAGHPDHPNLTNRALYPDKRARGWIKEVVVAENEARFVVAYNELGKGEVDDAQWAGYSPLWLMTPAGNVGGRKAYRPAKLQSFGLTNNPNMDIEPIIVANEADAEPPKEETKPEGGTLITRLTAALKAEGIIKEEDGEEAIMEAIGQLISNLAWTRKRKTEMETEEAKLRLLAGATCSANDAGTVAILDAAITKISTAAANETSAATREKALTLQVAALADRALDAGIAAGALTPPDRAARRDQILAAVNEADIKAVLDGLAKPPAQAATTLMSANLGQSKPAVMAANDGTARLAQRNAAVNEAMAEITKGREAKPGDKERAWNLARQRQPELFAH